MDHKEIAETFKSWNAGELESYLIEITGEIFNKLDEDGTPLVEKLWIKLAKKVQVNGLQLML